MTMQQEQLTSIPHNWNKTYTKHHPYQSLKEKANTFSLSFFDTYSKAASSRPVYFSIYEFLAKGHSTSNFPFISLLKI